jgi:TRAP-type C4-dicarboxylate transport system permease small subunit
MLRSFVKILDTILQRLLIVLMALLVLDVLWQVASRYVFRSPSAFTDELARYLLIWVSLLGAAYASGKKMHLSLDLVYNRFRPSLRQKVHVLISALIAVFAGLVMGFGGIKLVVLTLTLGQHSAALGVPLGYVYLAVPISGLIIFLYAVANMFTPPGVVPGGKAPVDTDVIPTNPKKEPV